MRRFLGVLMSVCMMSFVVGCGAAEETEQTATYVLVQEEADMYTMTDTQILNAKGDKVYELLETTEMEFAQIDETTRTTLVEYYDSTVEEMKANAPEGVEVASSYKDNVYTLTMNLYLENADLQTLMDGGYLMGLNEDGPEEFTFISFKQTCAGLEASGYILKQ